MYKENFQVCFLDNEDDWREELSGYIRQTENSGRNS